MRSAAVMLAALAALAACGAPGPERKAGAALPWAPLAVGDLELSGLSVSGDGFGEPRLLLAVERAITERRKTANGVFVYQNLDDLRLSGVSVELHGRQPSADAPPFDLLGALADEVAELHGRRRTLSRRSEVESRVVSRVFFDALTIRIRLAPGRVVSIQAGRARADAAFRALVLGGGVTVTDAGGATLRAQSALWPRDPPGVSVPAGHRLAGAARDRDAFYAIDATGRLAERQPPPQLSVRDPVQEMEERWLGGVQESLLGVVLGVGPGLGAAR